MFFFKNPIREKMKDLVSTKLRIEKEMLAVEKEMLELQESCPHHHKTVVTNEMDEDWTSCEDCGKLLYQ